MIDKEKIIAYLVLMRADKPVGTVLLACPMLWALWLAADGSPQPDVVLIFLLGAFLMRSAGCVINDVADRDIDHLVTRTKSRPLTSGKLTTKAALVLFVVLIALAGLLLVFLPAVTILPAGASAALATLYPFTKRFFKIPQLILGMAFSSSVLMAYTATLGEIPLAAWLLFIAATVWTIVYDTFYAMVDRDDDSKIGIQSSALWFGDKDLRVNALLIGVFIALMVIIGVLNAVNGYFYLGLLLACGCFAYQLLITRSRTREACFAAFLNNQWVGVLIFLGIVLSFL